MESRDTKDETWGIEDEIQELEKRLEAAKARFANRASSTLSSTGGHPTHGLATTNGEKILHLVEKVNPNQLQRPSFPKQIISSCSFPIPRSPSVHLPSVVVWNPTSHTLNPNHRFRISSHSHSLPTHLPLSRLYSLRIGIQEIWLI